jgi:hypothetical protein
MPFIKSFHGDIMLTNPHTHPLSLGLESVGEAPHVLGQVALVAQELDVSAVVLEAALGALGNVVLAAERREAPVLGDDNLLAAGELVLGAAEGFDGGGTVGVTGSHGKEDLANVDAGDEAVGLAKGTAHSSLESIGSGTRQHLVDADDVVWVDTDTEMETFLSGNLDEVPGVFC